MKAIQITLAVLAAASLTFFASCKSSSSNTQPPMSSGTYVPSK